MDIATALTTITAIRPEQRKTLPGPPDGSFVREEYYNDGHVWIGMVTTRAGLASPWHHHGKYTTYAYVLEGEARVEFGDDGAQAVDLKAASDGSLAILPPGKTHREVNTGTTPNRLLIIRVGEGEPVFPVADPTQG